MLDFIVFDFRIISSLLVFLDGGNQYTIFFSDSVDLLFALIYLCLKFVLIVRVNHLQSQLLITLDDSLWNYSTFRNLFFLELVNLDLKQFYFFSLNIVSRSEIDDFLRELLFVFDSQTLIQLWYFTLVLHKVRHKLGLLSPAGPLGHLGNIEDLVQVILQTIFYFSFNVLVL